MEDNFDENLTRTFWCFDLLWKFGIIMIAIMYSLKICTFHKRKIVIYEVILNLYYCRSRTLLSLFVQKSTILILAKSACQWFIANDSEANSHDIPNVEYKVSTVFVNKDFFPGLLNYNSRDSQKSREFVRLYSFMKLLVISSPKSALPGQMLSQLCTKKVTLAIKLRKANS